MTSLSAFFRVGHFIFVFFIITVKGDLTFKTAFVYDIGYFSVGVLWVVHKFDGFLCADVVYKRRKMLPDRLVEKFAAIFFGVSEMLCHRRKRYVGR